MSENTVGGEYAGVWDINFKTNRGYEISSHCTINLDTGLVDPDMSDDADADVDILDRAYVTVSGREFSVVKNDEEEEVVEDLAAFKSFIAELRSGPTC